MKKRAFEHSKEIHKRRVSVLSERMSMSNSAFSEHRSGQMSNRSGLRSRTPRVEENSNYDFQQSKFSLSNTRRGSHSVALTQFGPKLNVDAYGNNNGIISEAPPLNIQKFKIGRATPANDHRSRAPALTIQSSKRNSQENSVRDILQSNLQMYGSHSVFSIHRPTLNPLTNSNSDIPDDSSLDPPKKPSQDPPKTIFDRLKKIYQDKKKTKSAKILDWLVTRILLNFFTLYALFADNFRILGFGKSADTFFDCLTIFCFC
jgi:hypothetical protein